MVNVRKWEISAGIVLLSQTVQTAAHIYFDHPEPRGCFYGFPLGDGDKDGPWRTKPCGREPDEPKLTVQAGASMCLKVHEFVPHPGWFEIHLAPRPVGPDGSDGAFDPANGGAHLGRFDDAATPDTGKTGIQAFWVTIPRNFSPCDRCTLQVRQWAEDFQWYYYSCTDIKITAADLGSGNGTESGIGYGDGTGISIAPPPSCRWEEKGPRLRVQILQTILFGTAGLISLLAWTGFLIFVYVRSTKNATDYQAGDQQNGTKGEKGATDDISTNEKEKRETSVAEKTPAGAIPNVIDVDAEEGKYGKDSENVKTNGTKKTSFWRELKKYPKCIAGLVAFTCFSMLMVGVPIIILKTCSY